MLGAGDFPAQRSSSVIYLLTTVQDLGPKCVCVGGGGGCLLPSRCSLGVLRHCQSTIENSFGRT